MCARSANMQDDKWPYPHPSWPENVYVPSCKAVNTTVIAKNRQCLSMRRLKAELKRHFASQRQSD